jgi:hypothetical protein
MSSRITFIELSYAALAGKVDDIVRAGARGHIHTTVPGCAITGSTQRAIVLEATDEGKAYAFFDDQPIEARAKPLAILLHGEDSVPADTEDLEPACEAVVAMAERMRGGKGHFHILNPACQFNRHPGRWTVLFEDVERGPLESVSDERPLADIRLVERLIYAKGSPSAADSSPG